ncbi:MAG: metalloregulator ArsR/SmtB family transcription factor [Lactobacillus sp.]|jgi:DNA-binding transcriptional ArsR family regulator|nr:metalloregulator ArsR/SmtB family transcription factor [Lactobacillus sp.]
MRKELIGKAAKILKALGNEKRLQIAYILLDKELKVGDLEKLVGLSQSALSQHLAVLREAEVVKTRRDAQTIYYSICNDKVVKTLLLLDNLYAKIY